MWAFVRRAWSTKEAQVALLIGFIATAMALAFVVLLHFSLEHKIFPSIKQKPWDYIFVFGVLFSLFAQISIAAYFSNLNYQGTVNLFPGWQWLMALASTLLVVCSILFIHHPKLHLLFIVTYAVLLVVWDAIPLWHRPATHSAYIDRVEDVLQTVDFPVAAVLVVWTLGYFVWNWGWHDVGLFVSNSDLKDCRDSCLESIGTKGIHISEPIMAGVIGFQMFLVFVVIFVHLSRWQRPEASVSTAPIAIGSSPP